MAKKVNPYSDNRNKWLYMLCRELHELVEELNVSQSADRVGQGLHPADIERIEQQMLPAVRNVLEYMDQQPELDRPNTSSTPIPIPDAPDVPDCENTLLQSVSWELVDLYRELVESGQTGRLRVGIDAHDYNRAVETLDNVENNLLPMIKESTPIDKPDTQPDSESVTTEPDWSGDES